MDIVDIIEAIIQKVVSIIGGINYKLILFLLLAPIYFPMYAFLHLTGGWWEDLID